MRILIVEDETALASGLKFNFEQEGYEVSHAPDGATALELFQSEERRIDLVILDLMLPGISGYETCRAMRSMDASIPILVLSARTLSEDKALAFDCGTDQYMTKPFALPELLSRVRNLIERRRTAGSHARARVQNIVSFGSVTVNFDTYEVQVDNQTHTLTTMELQLLRYFIEHEGVVLSRSQILADVWKDSAAFTTRSIDNFVLRLRKIVEPDPSNPRHILSIRGTGYRFLAAGR